MCKCVWRVIIRNSCHHHHHTSARQPEPHWIIPRGNRPRGIVSIEFTAPFFFPSSMFVTATFFEAACVRPEFWVKSFLKVFFSSSYSFSIPPIHYVYATTHRQRLRSYMTQLSPYGPCADIAVKNCFGNVNIQSCVTPKFDKLNDVYVWTLKKKKRISLLAHCFLGVNFLFIKLCYSL